MVIPNLVPKSSYQRSLSQPFVVRTALQLVVLLALVFIGNLAFGESHYSGSVGSFNAPSPVALIPSNPEEITLSVTVPEPLIDSAVVHESVYHTVKIPGWEATDEPGLPRLPVWNQLVALPQCESVDLTAVAAESLVIQGYHVYPSERHISKISPDGYPYQQTVFEIDQSAYSLDRFYPSSLCEILDIFYVREQKVLLLGIHPVRYNPKRGCLVVYTSVDVHIRPEGVTGPISRSVGPFDRVAERLVLAYDGQPDPPGARLLSGQGLDGASGWCHSFQECANLQADYLMLVAHRFFHEGDSTSAAFRLADHRATTSGFNVAIVNAESLGLTIDTTPDGLVRAFIDSLYHTETAEHMSDHRLGYCLLVGGFVDTSGDTLVPVHWEETWWEGDDYPSDNWFVAFNDTAPSGNPLPQIQIGRLAVLDSLDLETVADKIISSEPLPNTGAWTNKVFLTSGKNLYDQDEEDTLESTFASISKIADEAGLDTLLFRGDWMAGDYHFGSENCRVINAGARFVHFGIHGEPCRMAHPAAFSTDSLDCFANTDSLPIFFTGACRTAAFQNLCLGSADTTCIGSALLNLPTGGVVAFLGPADFGELTADYKACVDIFAAWFKYHSPLIGDAWFEAKLRKFGAHNFIKRYTILGDPAFNVLLRESGVGYCDLGVRDDEFAFEPELDVRAPETTISMPVRNLTPYPVESDTLRVHFYMKPATDTTGWELIDSCFVGPIEPWSADTASVVWDVSTSAIASGEYDLKAVADPRDDLLEAYENNNMAVTRVPIGITLTGFPAWLRANPVTSPTPISLIDNYGNKETYVLICTEEGTLRAVNARGGLAWSYDTDDLPIFAVAAGDLCQDGSTLQVVASGDSLRAIDGFDSPVTKWIMPLPGGAESRTSPSLSDLDFDQNHDLEVVIGVVDGTTSKVLAINCSTDSAWVMWSSSLGDTGTVGLPGEPILLVDLDNDTSDDVVISTTHGFLFSLDGATGTVRTQVDVAPGDALPPTNPVASDLDLDGSAEIVCASTVLAVFQANPSLTLEASVALDSERGLYLSAANIDHQDDPQPEIVLSTTNRLAVYDYLPGESPALQERFDRPSATRVHTMPAVGDVKWVVGPEIVYASGDSMYVLSNTGVLVARTALGDTIDSSPCLADLTGDGFPEIIVAISDSLAAVPGAGQTKNLEWAMFGGDIRHRGVRSNVLSGSMATDRILWGKNTIVGKLTIPQQRTLIVEPGTVVEFAPGPGFPRGEMQLWVEGDLVLNGTAAQPVTFTSGYFEKSRGDWDAIELYGSDSLEVKYCNFEYAYQAVRSLGRAPTIRECSFSECADCGIYVDNDSPRIECCSFESNRCDISLLSATAVIESCSFERQDVCGVFCWADNGSVVRGNRFAGSGCHGWAIYIYEILSPLLITNNWIQGYGSRGILSDGAYRSSCTLHHNMVWSIGGPGMEFNESSYPQEHWGRAYLDSNIIFSCTYGIWSNAENLRDYPVLEAYGDSAGNNSIKNNLHKEAKNTSESLLIPARRNWWGFDCSDPDSVAAHIEGLFDIDPCLDTDPDPYAGVGSQVSSPPVVLRQNAPNPFINTTKIQFVLGRPAKVRLSVYNVRGQLVRTLLDRTAHEGEHSILWDGTTQAGSQVSPGIYFYVLSTPISTQTKKLVLLK